MAKRKATLKETNSSQAYDSLPQLPTEKLEKTKDLVKWLWRRWRWSGLIPLGVIIVLALWLNWKDIQELLGVSTATAWLWRESLPLADPSKFSIVLVNLENDQNGYEAKLIAESLRELAGKTIQILRIDRLVAMTNSDSELALHEAHENARQLLAQTQAQVLIWGTVLNHDQKAVAKLHWTVNKDLQREIRESNRYPVTTSDLDLPPVFWEDMQQILALLVLNEGARNDSGHYPVDKLKPFIERILDLMSRLDAKRVWSAHQKAQLQVALGNAFSTYGEQAGDLSALIEASDAYLAALEGFSREQVPLDWAATQNNLGNTLRMMGEWKSDTKMLWSAVATYRAALEERTRERVPLRWAATQNNLGNALRILGDLELGTETLRTAAAAYRAALEERTREQAPLDWAKTMSNLGNVLVMLGDRESDTKMQRLAVAAYQSALEEFTRKRVPLDWAWTQNNLGNALMRLGQRESDTELLWSAVAAYQAAFKEFTRTRVPWGWAATQSNLCNTFRALGERESSTEILRAAVVVCSSALEERTRERVPLDWAGTQNNLGGVLRALGERESSTELLLLAETAYLNALSVFKAVKAYSYIESARKDLEIVSTLMAKLKSDK